MLRQDQRCDRCGARARVEVTLPSGPLLFCGHHFAVHKTVLQRQEAAITDYHPSPVIE